MKCICCDKEISEMNDQYEPYGYDGDFIHTKCKKKMQENMDKLCEASDKDFERYMRGGEL